MQAAILSPSRRKWPCPQQAERGYDPREPEDADVPKQAEIILSPSRYCLKAGKSALVPRSQKMPMSPSRQEAEGGHVPKQAVTESGFLSPSRQEEQRLAVNTR